jgi:2-dehydropantoate 2-reductase
MRILVYGAGVLGSLYAARLHDADHDVTILARGERLAAIREHGIVIRDDGTGLLTTSLVPAIDHLDPNDPYDLVMVVVRRDQVAGVLPALAASLATPTALFMGNNAAGPAELVAALGRERVMLGFPSAGGALVDGVVHARIASGRTFPTMIGELDGETTERAAEIAAVLISAGFRVSISCCMDAWLKTHAALVIPIAGAIYAAGGDMGRLARTPDIRILTVRAVREGFATLRALDIPVVPTGYRRLIALPEGVLGGYLARVADSERARLMLARHALAARSEMSMLATEFRALAERAEIEMPAFERLVSYADPSIEPMEDGSRTLLVRHPERAAAVGGLAALAGLGIGLLVLRRARPDLVGRLPMPRLFMPRLPGALASAIHLPAIALPALALPAFALPTSAPPTIHLRTRGPVGSASAVPPLAAWPQLRVASERALAAWPQLRVASERALRALIVTVAAGRIARLVR